MEEEMVKTTIVVPKALWRRVRIRAAEEDADFRTTVIRALEFFLASPPPQRTRVRMLPGREAREIVRAIQESKEKKGGERR